MPIWLRVAGTVVLSVLAVIAGGSSALYGFIFLLTPSGDRCETLGPGCDGLTSPQLAAASATGVVVCLLAIAGIVLIWRFGARTGRGITAGHV